ncbi:MAG: glycosyltransferase family 2 protein [Acidobacteriaceae bacterium]
MNTLSISVVVPVFNEESGIQPLAQRLANVRAFWPGRSVQFVFVNDGSVDLTEAALKRAFGDDSMCTIVSHGRNQGIGAAFRTGFIHAYGDIVCTIDADCSYGPENLKLLVDALDREQADISVASPYHPDGRVDGVPGWRLLLSKGCSLFYQCIAPVRLYTYTSVFRAYRRRVVESIAFEENGFVSAAEVLIRAAEQGFHIVEVPMTLHARKIGQSKMKVLRTIRQHLGLMARSAGGHRLPVETKYSKV